MRISDWSSDVCSSDLDFSGLDGVILTILRSICPLFSDSMVDLLILMKVTLVRSFEYALRQASAGRRESGAGSSSHHDCRARTARRLPDGPCSPNPRDLPGPAGSAGACVPQWRRRRRRKNRSEEHTSEPQALMRIS